MFHALSKVLDIFLGPYTWGIILLALTTPWKKKSTRHWRRRRAYGIAGLAVLLVGGLGPPSHWIMARLERSVPVTYRPDVTYDAVVLLGGLVDEEATAENGVPSFNDSVERMLVTFDLLRQDRARFVIVSAGTNEAFPEAGESAVIAKQLESWGIAKERILLDDKSQNTRENALFSQQIAKERGFRKTVLVTSAFHMSRAFATFEAVDMPVDTLPVDYRAHPHAGRSAGEWIPRVDGLDDTTGLLHELFGRLIYRVKGYSR